MMIDNGYQISDFVRRTGVAIADDLLINDHDKSYQEIYNEGYSQIINKGLSIKEVSEYMDKYMNEHNLPEYDVIKYGYLEEKLLNDLKRLIRALELYLTRYVAQITITQKLPDIEEQQFTYILSFNYTDTYSKLYSNEEKIICSYIHGKAVETNNIDNNKMVLGIDEYLADEDRKKDVRFVDFTKFYQRVYKQTGSEYRYWINTINNDSTPTVYEDCILDDGKSGIRVLNKYNLFIFGHSLDVTDKDVLSDFLLNDKLKITIFYYNEKQRAQQIRNLIKLIGSKELIKRTGGYNQTIYFRKQKDAIFNAAKS